MKNFKIKNLIIALSCILFVAGGLSLPEIINAQQQDAIGIRVMANPNHYSPAEWYRWVGFKGSPQSMIVDGYEAVQDGNTIYINGSNVIESGVYTNIYVITLSEGASFETVNIFEQLLNNWKLNVNLVNPDDKEMLIRDIKRLVDLRNMEESLSNYYSTNKYCELNHQKSCASNADCSRAEGSCVNHYPDLDAGTYIRSLAVSTWGSWNAVLGGNIGATPSDPINEMVNCQDPYDELTCWNPASFTYICPEGSHVYQYQSIGGISYTLGTEMEYINRAELQGDKMYGVNFSGICNVEPILDAEGQITGYESGTFYTNQNLCGDGLVGPGEECDSLSRNYCDYLPDGDYNPRDWYNEPQMQICNPPGAPDECTWSEDIPTSLDCGGYCGDGENQPEYGEICESDSHEVTPQESSANNQYICRSDCRGTIGGFCGDGYSQDAILANGVLRDFEECDDNGFTTPSPEQSSEDYQYECNSCRFSGGWNGDGIIDEQEAECDLSQQDEVCESLQSVFPPYCPAGLSGERDCTSSGTWGECDAINPDAVGGTSTACSSTNVVLTDKTCCELTGCSQDGCTCGGRSGGASIPSGYYEVDSMTPVWDPEQTSGTWATGPFDGACRLVRSSTNPRDWQVRTIHSTAYYQCWD